MGDLIRRQDVIDIIMGDGLYCDTYDDKEYSAERIKSIPAVDLSQYCDKLWKTAYEHGKRDAQPRRGKWVTADDKYIDVCKCSECGTIEYFNKGWKKFDYCPNCGARMEDL